MWSDAPTYSSHRSFQSYGAEVFLKTTVPKMDWTGQESEVVMDIGCAAGDSTRNQLLPIFPRVEKLIAVDILPEMIEFAKKNNASDKIEYHVANIENWQTVEKWAQQITKVISVFVFNWVKNQKQAFKHIFNLLKPGGEAALVFVLHTKFWDSYEIHMNSLKWGKYLKNADTGVPDSHYKNYDASYYRHMLENIGFEVVLCEEENGGFAFLNDDDCRGAIFCAGLTKHIPDEMKNEFKEDLFEGFLQYNGRNSEGKPMMYYKNLTVLIRKPKINSS